MKFSTLSGLLVLVGLSVALSGCGKKEAPETVAEKPAPAAAAAMPAPVDETPAAKPAMAAKAETMMAKVEVPDLKAASSAKLAEISGMALTQLAALGGAKQPEMAREAEAVKTALAGDDALGALSKLQSLASYAEQIPGAPILLESAKQMVSAWALKQGFDTAKIAPVLSALQSRDYAGLASQAAMLAGTGGLTAEQKALVNGVLQTYGVDAKVDNVLGKVKSLF